MLTVVERANWRELGFVRTIGAEEVIAMEEDADLEFSIFCLFALGGFKLEEDEDLTYDVYIVFNSRRTDYKTVEHALNLWQCVFIWEDKVNLLVRKYLDQGLSASFKDLKIIKKTFKF